MMTTSSEYFKKCHILIKQSIPLFYISLNYDTVQQLHSNVIISQEKLCR